MTLLWFISFVLLLVIELVTVNLVTIWFVIGALAAMILSFFIDSFVIQIVVFIVVSVIALLVTRPIVKKFKGFSVVPTNSDMVIGKTGVVTKKIEANKYGEVKVFGNSWMATSSDEIDVDKKVRILSIDGVKLIVEKEEK